MALVTEDEFRGCELMGWLIEHGIEVGSNARAVDIHIAVNEIVTYTVTRYGTGELLASTETRPAPRELFGLESKDKCSQA